jgi:hypothetical protein
LASQALSDGTRLAGARSGTRRRLATSLAFALLVVGAPADGSDLFGRDGAHFGGHHGIGGRDGTDGVTRRVTLHSPELARFVARVRFESGIRLEEIRLDAGLRAEASVVRRRGSLGDVRRLRQRAEGREFDLRLRTGAALADVERILASGDLGATTRRVLERNRVTLRQHQRDLDLDMRTRTLEAEVAKREARERRRLPAPLH